MLHILKQQYNLISSTRETLFSFLEEIPVEKLHSTVPNFGSGSIIKTHIHVADCYRYWLGSFAFKQKEQIFHLLAITKLSMQMWKKFALDLS